MEQWQLHLFEAITAIAGIGLAYIVYRFISTLVSLLVLVGMVVLIYFYITQPDTTMVVYEHIAHQLSVRS